MPRQRVPSALYMDGVRWIAQNDNEGAGDNVQAISEYISTCLLADMFAKDRMEVAEEIAKVRERLVLPVAR